MRKKLLLLILLVLVIGFNSNVKALNIPDADVTYTEDWEGTLVIDSDTTIKISGITHSNEGTTYAAAIKITNNATVNIVFEGNNVIVANSDVIGAGIQVDEGSTLNLYGLEGASLNVTGGKFGAGIGGTGYSSSSEDNPKAGNITIYSGKITAIGGLDGSGIGSGQHSSATNITIYDGDIIALGNFGGAGIGTGYGSSGGAVTKIGYYNGGNIRISGGTVKAASYHINFDNFDPYNLDTLYGEGYQDSFAAGIGGGYGSSSGTIIIEGDADVIAIGSCGGAGIGSGRGTTKNNNYDFNNFDVDVTIQGNAHVMAFATNDRRESMVGDEGGAAIGLGRGTGLEENHYVGKVRILGNASVYAVGSYKTQAIGGSTVVGKYTKDSDGNVIRPANASLEVLAIAPTTKVIAISDGYRTPLDATSNFINLKFENELYSNRDDIFTDDAFPTKITDGELTFAISSPSKYEVMIQNANKEKYSFYLKDKLGENNEKLYLTNDLEEITTEFIPSNKNVISYDLNNISSRLDSSFTIDDPTYGEINIIISSKEGIFEYGSTFKASIIDDEDELKELYSKLDEEYSDKVERILFIDLSVLDRSNTEYHKLNDTVKVYIEIPEGWDKDEVQVLFIKNGKDETFVEDSELEEIDGKTYLKYKVNHFSVYSLYDPIHPTNNPTTGDNIFKYLVMLLISMSGLLIAGKRIIKNI